MALTLAAALLALAVVLYVISPILQGRFAPMSVPGEARDDAQVRKKVALRALRDAEFDFDAGKLDQADYEALRAELSSEALLAVERAEALDKPDEVPVAASGGSSPDVEAKIAEVRAGLRTGSTCRHCGQTNRAGSNFCTNCGRPLDRPASAPTGV